MGEKIKKWKPEKWQGRSQQQVESNYKVMGYGCAFLFVMFVFMGILNAIIGVLA